MLTSYFTPSGDAFFAHPSPRPPHWAAVGMSLGSDMNGFAVQVGTRFNRNGGTCCYGEPGFSFDPEMDPDAVPRMLAQYEAANGVYYAGGAPTEETADSAAPGFGIPAQPALKRLRFDPSLGEDV